MKILKWLFNTNIGYFILEHKYQYNGIDYKGYILCRGYRMFGLFGYDKLVIATDEEELKQIINFYINKTK